MSILGDTVTRAVGLDGSVWIVSLPKARTHFKGTCRLEITDAGIVSLRTWSSMTTTSAISSKRISSAGASAASAGNCGTGGRPR